MADIKKLMEEAAGADLDLAGDAWLNIRDVTQAALPAVLEYMEGGHHAYCLWWQAFNGQRGGCTCGYDNLCKALG